MEFGPQIKAIGYLMKLSFHLYMDHQKLSSYVSWASILLKTGPKGRGRVELDLGLHIGDSVRISFGPPSPFRCPF